LVILKETKTTSADTRLYTILGVHNPLPKSAPSLRRERDSNLRRYFSPVQLS
jgi:hypothetical protein